MVAPGKFGWILKVIISIFWLRRVVPMILTLNKKAMGFWIVFPGQGNGGYWLRHWQLLTIPEAPYNERNGKALEWGIKHMGRGLDLVCGVIVSSLPAADRPPEVVGCGQGWGGLLQNLGPLGLVDVVVGHRKAIGLTTGLVTFQVLHPLSPL